MPDPINDTNAINLGGYRSAKCPDGILRQRANAPESEKASATF
jgi:hypothetical protein